MVSSRNDVWTAHCAVIKEHAQERQPSHHLLGRLLRRRELTGPWRGKPHGLGGDYFSAILRHTALIEDHPQPCKYPPWLFSPQDPQDQKSVLHHRACWLMAS